MNSTRLALFALVGLLAVGATFGMEEEVARIGQKRCVCTVSAFMWDESSIFDFPAADTIPYLPIRNNKIYESLSPNPMFYLLSKTRINKGLNDHSCSNTQYTLHMSTDKEAAETGVWQEEITFNAEKTVSAKTLRADPLTVGYWKVFNCHNLRTPFAVEDIEV